MSKDSIYLNQTLKGKPRSSPYDFILPFLANYGQTKATMSNLKIILFSFASHNDQIKEPKNVVTLQLGFFSKSRTNLAKIVRICHP